MAQGGTASVLRRKAAQGREAAAAAVPPGPARALADAIRRAAEEELSLAVAPVEPQERRATPDEILESLPEHAFLALLIGPEDGAGLVTLDPGALSAVIEMRTIGRVTSRPPVTRRPTATDAAMVADVIDRILAEFEAPLMAGDHARWAAGWRYQMFLPEPRPLPVVLEDVEHRVLEVEIQFGAAAKAGRLTVALPATGRARPRPAAPPAPDSARGRAEAAWRAAIGEAVEGAEAALGTVLGRIRLPLADLARLAPGDRIALPVTALGAVQLCGPGGVVVGAGRLGQTGGLRALKLGPPDADATPVTTGEIIAAGRLGRSAAAMPMAAFAAPGSGGAAALAAQAAGQGMGQGAGLAPFAGPGAEPDAAFDAASDPRSVARVGAGAGAGAGGGAGGGGGAGDAGAWQGAAPEQTGQLLPGELGPSALDGLFRGQDTGQDHARRALSGDPGGDLAGPVAGGALPDLPPEGAFGPAPL